MPRVCLISSSSHCWWSFIVSSIPIFCLLYLEVQDFSSIFVLRGSVLVYFFVIGRCVKSWWRFLKHIDFSIHSIVKRTYSWKNCPGIHVFVAYIPLVCYVMLTLTKCCWGVVASSKSSVLFEDSIRVQQQFWGVWAT